MLVEPKIGCRRAARLFFVGFAIVGLGLLSPCELRASGGHPLVAPRRGPIDRALNIVAADSNRDGYDDLAWPISKAAPSAS